MNRRAWTVFYTLTVITWVTLAIAVIRNHVIQ